MADALHASGEIDRDPAIRVAIVTSTDCGVFCAGMTTEANAIQQQRGVDTTLLRDPFYERMRAIETPVIAALNGHFPAAGMVLAANADLRVGLAGTRAGITEVRVGRGTPWAVPMLWMLPQAVLLEMLLTGEMLPVERLRR
jgi:enoyl-CoA hydratase/carnithine racemase